MLLLLFVVLVVLPIIELSLLFKLGDWLGWIPTLALVLGAGWAGAAVARFEGWRSALRVRQQLLQGVLPAAEAFDGLLIAAAGLLLIIPGVLSDVLGLVLLLPPTRKIVRQQLTRFLRNRFHAQFLGQIDRSEAPPRRGDRIVDARVIETRFVD